MGSRSERLFGPPERRAFVPLDIRGRKTPSLGSGRHLLNLL